MPAPLEAQGETLQKPSDRERLARLASFGRCNLETAAIVLYRNKSKIKQSERDLLLSLIGDESYNAIVTEFHDVLEQTGASRVMGALHRLGIDVYGLEALVFAFRAQMRWIGEIEEAELVRGVYMHRSNEQVDVQSEEFYVFVFDLLTSYRYKDMPVDIAEKECEILLGGWSLKDDFIAFIRQRQVLTRDEWASLFRFKSTYPSAPIHEYNSYAFPLLFDSFVKDV